MAFYLLVLLIATQSVMAGTLSPPPQKQEVGVNISLATQIHITRDSTLESTQMDSLVAFMEHELGSAYSMTPNSGVEIALHRVTYPLFPRIGTEGYRLVVDQPADARIAISAMAEHGVFNGMMTTLQLLLRDNGAKEDSIRMQTITDYPDHPIRGADWRLLKLRFCNASTGEPLPSAKAPGPGVDFCITDSAKTRIDFLARHKINHALFVPDPIYLALKEDWWSDYNGADAFGELVDYCETRFIDLVPAVGWVSAYTDLEYVDGWWNKEQPFVFATVQDGGVQFNGSFEDDTINGDGLPDGWRVLPEAYVNEWQMDHTHFFDGNVSMRVEQVGTGPLLYFYQSIPVQPGDAGYGISVHVDGARIRVGMYGQDSLGINIGMQRYINCESASGWQECSTSLNSQVLPITPQTKYIEVSATANYFEGISGTTYIDNLQVLPMTRVVQGGDTTWTFVERSPLQVAVPGERSLLKNKSLEEISPLDPCPTDWSFTADGWGDSTAAVAFIHQDTLLAFSGTACAQINIAEEAQPDSATQTNVILSQVVPLPDTSAATYRLTAWVKASWTRGSENSYPELNMYAVNADSSIAETAGQYIDRTCQGCSPDTTEWIFQQIDLPVASNRDKIVVYARIPPPSYGSLWLDDLALVQLPKYPPLHELAKNPSFEYAEPESLLPQHWTPIWGGQGAGWSRSDSTARTGNYSLRFDGHGITYAPAGPAVAQTFNNPEPGRYLFSGWIKAGYAANRDTLPQLTLVSSDQYKTARTFLATVGGQSAYYSDQFWTRMRGIINVAPGTTSLLLYTRSWDKGGVFYLDDVSLRRINGDARNIVDQVYRPVVASTDSVYSPDSLGTGDYRIWRPRVTHTYDEGEVPTRIVRSQASRISPNKPLLVSYDQHLYHDYTRSWDQAQNLCLSCPRNVLTTYLNPAALRFLNAGASAAQLFWLTEMRGINRSGATRSDSLSNAEVLGSFANAFVDTVLAANANARLYSVHDMLSLYHNGAPGDQVPFGGQSDPIADVISDQEASYHLSEDVRIDCWHYLPKWFGTMSAEAQWFEENGYNTLQDTWYDTVNVRQAAAVSRGIPHSLGGVATTWPDILPANPPVALQDSANRAWITNVSNEFWKSPWRQVLFTDLNDRTLEGLSFYSDSRIDSDERPFLKFYAPGAVASNGSIVCPPGGGVFSLDNIPVDNASTYRLILHARAIDGDTTHAVVALHTDWFDIDGNYWSPTPINYVTIGGPGESNPSDSNRNYFNRYEVDLARPTYPEQFTHFEIYAYVDPQDTLVIDDVAIWESDAPCPETELDFRTPLAIGMGEIPYGTRYRFSADLWNSGCRDVQITAIGVSAGTTVADSLGFYQTPPVILGLDEHFHLVALSDVAPPAGIERNYNLDVYWHPYNGEAHLTRIPISYTTSEEL